MKCSFCELNKNELTLYSRDQKICNSCIKKTDFLVRTAEGNILGPYSTKELNALVENKIIVLLDEISLNGSEWLFLKDIELFKSAMEKSSYELDEKTMNISTKIIHKGDLPPTFVENNINKTTDKQVEKSDIREIFNKEFFEEQSNNAINEKSKNFFLKQSFVAISILVTVFLSIFVYDGYIKNKFVKGATASTIDDEKFSFNDYLLKAKEYQQTGLFKEADKFYIKSLEISPKSSPARLYHAGIALVEENNLSLAQTILAKLETEINMGQITEKNLKTDTNIFLGLLAMKLDKQENAVNYFKKAIAIDHSNKSAFYNLGVLYFKNENYDIAIQYFNSILEIDANNTDAMMYKGLISLFKQKYKEAAETFRKVTLKYPYGSMPYIYEAYAWYKLNDLSKTQELIKNITNLEPFFGGKLAKKLRYLTLKEKLVKYEKEFLDEISSAKEILKNPDIYVVQAFVLAEEEDYKIAKKILVKEIKRFDENSSLFASLGMLYYKEKNNKAAMHYIEKALMFDYSNALAHLYAALISLEDENTLTQALNHGIKAYTSNNLFLFALMIQGDVYYKLKQTSEAMILWEKVLSLESRYYMAEYRIKLKQLKYIK